MPSRPLGPCTQPGCPNRATAGHGRCLEHARPAWQGSGRGLDHGAGVAWKTIRARVLSEEPTCRACGVNASTEVHHVTPRAQGGTHERSNLAGVCAPCHRRLTTRVGVARSVQ